jgi:hypothetical protein
VAIELVEATVSINKTPFWKDLTSILGTAMAMASLGAYFDGKLLYGLLLACGFLLVLRVTLCINLLTSIEKEPTEIGFYLLCYGIVSLVCVVLGAYKTKLDVIAIIVFVVAIGTISTALMLMKGRNEN